MIANEMKKTPIHIYIVQETKVNLVNVLIVIGQWYYQ